MRSKPVMQSNGVVVRKWSIRMLPNEQKEQLDEFIHLNNEAKTLLLNRPRMAKSKFIKKLDIYAIVMRTKLLDPNRDNLKLNIDALRNKLMKKQKTDEEIILEMMKNIEKASR